MVIQNIAVGTQRIPRISTGFGVVPALDGGLEPAIEIIQAPGPQSETFNIPVFINVGHFISAHCGGTPGCGNLHFTIEDLDGYSPGPRIHTSQCGLAKIEIGEGTSKNGHFPGIGFHGGVKGRGSVLKEEIGPTIRISISVGECAHVQTGLSIKKGQISVTESNDHSSAVPGVQGVPGVYGKVDLCGNGFAIPSRNDQSFIFKVLDVGNSGFGSKESC